MPSTPATIALSQPTVILSPINPPRKLKTKSITKPRTALRSSFNAHLIGDALGVTVTDNAKVYGNASLLDRCNIQDYAQVRDNALVEWNATVGGHAIIEGKAIITNNVIVDGKTRVKDKTIGDPSQIQYLRYRFGGKH